MKFFPLCASVLSALVLTACAAMQTSSEFKDLELNSSLDRPVFLANRDARKLFLEMDCPLIEWQHTFKDQVANGLTAKGYQLTTKPEEADLVMTVLVRKAGELEKTSARRVQGSAAPTIGGSTVVGAGVGAFGSKGDPMATIAGAAGGLVVGSVVDATVNSWVYLGALEIDAFIEVKENAPGSQTEVKKTDTRATARARQANLKWEEASEAIKGALVKQIVMSLPKKQG